MPVELIDPLNDQRWDAFLDWCPNASIFHTAAWARVITETYGYRHRYYALSQGDRIEAALPFFEVRSFLTGNRWVSLPFSDHAPLLATQAEHLGELLERIAADFSRSGCRYIEIRSGEAPLLGAAGTAPQGRHPFIRLEHHKLHLIPLSEDIDATYKRLDKRRARWAVRYAAKHGVEIIRDDSIEAMRSFHRISLGTRRKLGVPPQPWKLFENVHRIIIEPGHGFLLTARREGITLGSMVFFHHGRTVTAKYNASIKEYLKYQFAEAILWAAMKWGCENGFTIFDVGRTAIDNAGLLSMKRHMGGEELPLPYYYHPEAKGVGTIREKSLSYRAMKAIFKHMPVALTRPIGNLLYKHFG
ncbi:MAG: GNAT family N-acetyltransferase [bacterium]|nr:MAG: GNAT family N-acetyltransferase [bacterium]